MSPPGRTARWHGRRARPRFVRTGKGESARSMWRRALAGLPSRRRAFASRSHITAARRSGSRTRRPRRKAGVERLAPRRGVQPGRPFPGHRDAGADAAWLAADRRQAHAHVGLFGARALVRLDRGRRFARDLRLRPAHPLAVPGQGRADGQAAEPVRADSKRRVVVVACHPKQAVVAAGYADGMVLLVRIADGAEVLARRPDDAPVTALAFSPDGTQLAFGCEDGQAGMLALA